MDIPLVQIELIEDASSVAALSAEVRSKGQMLVCRRCMDASEIITGVLVIDATDEHWALCGPCWREMPQGSHIV